MLTDKRPIGSLCSSRSISVFHVYSGRRGEERDWGSRGGSRGGKPRGRGLFFPSLLSPSTDGSWHPSATSRLGQRNDELKAQQTGRFSGTRTPLCTHSGRGRTLPVCCTKSLSLCIPHCFTHAVIQKGFAPSSFGCRQGYTCARPQ